MKYFLALLLSVGLIGPAFALGDDAALVREGLVAPIASNTKLDRVPLYSGHRTHRGVRSREVGSGSLAGLVAPLRAKAQQMQSTCGAKIISTRRHTYVRGSGRLSLHASGRAFDVRGNPNCLRSLLVNWQGGASTDYYAVKHYHISWGGNEHGLRFAHSGKRKHYASRRHAHKTRYVQR